MKITDINLLQLGVIIGNEEGSWASEVIGVGEKFVKLKVLHHYHPSVKVGSIYQFHHYGHPNSFHDSRILKLQKITLEDLI